MYLPFMPSALHMICQPDAQPIAHAKCWPAAWQASPNSHQNQNAPLMWAGGISKLFTLPQQSMHRVHASAGLLQGLATRSFDH